MKIFYKYIPINLDRRGVYHPNHQIKIPQLYGKVEIFDESNTAITTPNTIYNFGYINLLDLTAEADVRDLIATLGVTVGMKEITTTEAKQMLTDNGYIETSTDVFEIVPSSLDEITGEPTEAVILTIV